MICIIFTSLSFIILLVNVMCMYLNLRLHKNLVGSCSKFYSARAELITYFKNYLSNGETKPETREAKD